MELNSDQQQKYQAQFDEEGEPIGEPVCVVITVVPGKEAQRDLTFQISHLPCFYC